MRLNKWLRDYISLKDTKVYRKEYVLILSTAMDKVKAFTRQELKLSETEIGIVPSQSLLFNQKRTDRLPWVIQDNSLPRIPAH